MKGRKPDLQSDQAAIVSVTRAPQWLSADAKAEWQRVMPHLIERRILTDADLGSLENYCVAIGQVRELERVIKRDGFVFQSSRGPRANPAVKLQADAMSRSLRLAAELGLTPVSRSRPVMRNDEENDDPSPLDL
jgi:P27 family predicted phage terminase small subunit